VQHLSLTEFKNVFFLLNSWLTVNGVRQCAILTWQDEDSVTVVVLVNSRWGRFEKMSQTERKTRLTSTEQAERISGRNWSKQINTTLKKKITHTERD